LYITLKKSSFIQRDYDILKRGGIDTERGRFDYILKRCKDKKVLHIGCVDEGLTRERYIYGQLLHQRLYNVTESLYGLDNSREGLKILWDYGFGNLIEMDIEEDYPKDSYDIVVVPEVLEHLNNPGKALYNIRNIKSNEFIFSVPSATLRFLEHPDHNFYFTEKSIRTLLGKHGFEIEDLVGYHFKRLQPWADGYLIMTT
jgi:2-polyprenyl-3-methyl-5-hydroxy-6-metoxy-1,4-benzoquinol methylase